jgi:hypothetical protein
MERRRYRLYAMRILIGILIGAGFIGLMVYAVMAESQVECEVCVEFGGRTECRTSVAVDRKHAVSGAMAGACAVLSGGVTDGIRCTSSIPKSQRCDG